MTMPDLRDTIEHQLARVAAMADSLRHFQSWHAATTNAPTAAYQHLLIRVFTDV